MKKIKIDTDLLKRVGFRRFFVAKNFIDDKEMTMMYMRNY